MKIIVRHAEPKSGSEKHFCVEADIDAKNNVARVNIYGTDYLIVIKKKNDSDAD